MGLATRIKGMLGGAEDEEPGYECRSCGAQFADPQTLCSTCGSPRVEEIE